MKIFWSRIWCKRDFLVACDRLNRALYCGFTEKISSRRHRHLIYIVKRNTKTDGMGPFNITWAKTLYLLFPCPNFPSSPSPHEYTSPSTDRARQCLPPEFTATFFINTCWNDSRRVGVPTESVPPTPRRPPAP